MVNISRKTEEYSDDFGASDSALMLTLCALQMLVLLLLLLLVYQYRYIANTLKSIRYFD